jgi:hypothetical protein
MTTTLNEDIAREVIRSRTTSPRYHDRARRTLTGRALRGLAHRLDGMD